MLRLGVPIAALILLGAHPVLAKCVGSTGVPFNCDAGSQPQPNDLFLGGSNNGATIGQTVKYTGSQIVGMDHSAAPVTSSGSIAATNSLAVWTGYLTGNDMPYSMSLRGLSISGPVGNTVTQALGTSTDALGQWKWNFHPTGNYAVSVLDLRDATDNGGSYGSGRPTVTSTLPSPSQTIYVSNVFPFQFDGRGHDFASGSYTAPVTINGVPYTQDGYTITGSGPAGTIHLTSSVSVANGTSGNPVRNGSHTIWLGTNQDLGLSDDGLSNLKYDSTLGGVTLRVANNPIFVAGSTSLVAKTKLGTYTAATAGLPTSTSNDKGSIAYATDCVNAGESSGSGTGCLAVVNNNGSWVKMPTGSSGGGGSTSGASVIQWNSTTTVTADTYYYSLSWPWASGTLSKVLYQTGGTSTPSFAIAVKINGVNVTGCSGITVSSSSTTSSNCTAANSVNAGDKITLVVSSVSGTPNAAAIQLQYTHP